MKGEDVRCLCKVMAHWMDKEGRRILGEKSPGLGLDIPNYSTM